MYISSLAPICTYILLVCIRTYHSCVQYLLLCTMLAISMYVSRMHVQYREVFSMLEGLNYYEASIEEQLGAISPIDPRYPKSFAPCNHFEDKMVAFSHGACLEDPVIRETGLLLPQVCTCVHTYIHTYVHMYVGTHCLYKYSIISSYVILHMYVLCPHSYIQMYVCAVCMWYGICVLYTYVCIYVHIRAYVSNMYIAYYVCLLEWYYMLRMYIYIIV